MIYMTLLNKILHLIQEETEKKTNQLLNKIGEKEQKDIQRDIPSKSQAETKNSDLLTRIEKLEGRILEIEKALALNLKSNSQLSSDISIVADSLRQLFNIIISTMDPDSVKTIEELKESEISEEADDFFKKKKRYQ